MRTSSHSVTMAIRRWYHISRDSWPTLKRVDVIWDRYLPDSLKATTRQRREAGIRKRLRHDGNGKFPRNRNRYLQNASNKVELFHYLSVAIAQTVFCEGKVVISTLDENVLGSPVAGADESDYPLRQCNHEEFDTRVCCRMQRMQYRTVISAYWLLRNTLT